MGHLDSARLGPDAALGIWKSERND